VPSAIGDAIVQFIEAGFDRTPLLAKDHDGNRFVYEEFSA